MNTHLHLRRQSIRALTSDELRSAHGGRGNNTGNNTTCGPTMACQPRTTTQTK